MKKKEYAITIWAVSLLLIGMLFVIFIFTGSNTMKDVTGATTVQAIEERTLAYVFNEMGDVDVDVLGVLEKNGRYEVSLLINDEDYVYVFSDDEEFLGKV